MRPVTSCWASSTVRATTVAGEATAPLVDVPGADLRAAVVFVDGIATPRCADLATNGQIPELGPSGMHLEVLDADGQVLACIA